MKKINSILIICMSIFLIGCNNDKINKKDIIKPMDVSATVITNQKTLIKEKNYE